MIRIRNRNGTIALWIGEWGKTMNGLLTLPIESTCTRWEGLEKSLEIDIRWSIRQGSCILDKTEKRVREDGNTEWAKVFQYIRDYNVMDMLISIQKGIQEQEREKEYRTPVRSSDEVYRLFGRGYIDRNGNKGKEYRSVELEQEQEEITDGERTGHLSGQEGIDNPTHKDITKEDERTKKRDGLSTLALTIGKWCKTRDIIEATSYGRGTMVDTESPAGRVQVISLPGEIVCLVPYRGKGLGNKALLTRDRLDTGPLTSEEIDILRDAMNALSHCIDGAMDYVGFEAFVSSIQRHRRQRTKPINEANRKREFITGVLFDTLLMRTWEFVSLFIPFE
jgi:hypothetical protein